MPTTAPADFRGARVVAFESRRARETAGLIGRFQGRPLVVPALREVPLRSTPELRTFAERLLAGGLDALILFTGHGARELVAAMSRAHPRQKILKALRRLRLIARGPKTVAALRALGFRPRHVVRGPGTWKDVLKALDRGGFRLKGARVAVQEGGVPNIPFLDALEARGVRVTRAPVYRWALPKDTGPLRDAVRRVASGGARAVLFTNANQVGHVFQVAREIGVEKSFRQGLSRAVVASIGPRSTERLRAFNVDVPVQSPRPRLDALVQAAASFAASHPNGSRPSLSAARSASRPTDARDSLLLGACRREKTERTPVWLMRQAGRYMKGYRNLRAKVSMLELCKHPDLVAEVTVDAVEKLGVDAAILFSDLLLIVEPLGFRLEYSRGEGPVIAPPLRRAADVDRLRPDAVAPALDYVAEAVRKTRAALAPGIPLLGFAGAPFTLASYLIEGGASRNFVRTKSFMYHEPAAWRRLMDTLARAVTGLLCLQIDAGADAVQLFDSWVGCLSPEDYRRFVLPHSRKVFAALRGRVPTIHFGTQTGDLLELMRDAGGDVIGLDWRVELDAAWKRLGRVAVMGNLDPVALFAPPREIRAQARRILRQAAGRPGHIFNLGHGILPDTPVDNVRALVDAVKEFGHAR